MNFKEDAFVTLVRLGIGHLASELPQNVDWTQIQALATRQGLSAVVLDGLNSLRRSGLKLTGLSQEFLLQWIGLVMQGYEGHYVAYRKAVVELAAFYNAHGYCMMLMKGLACGMDWPKPEHRPYGDIDIWLFGKQKEADALLEAEKPVQVVLGVQEFKIDNSHHHHTVFNWMGFTVENHYDFVNVHTHRSSAELEKVFKDLGKDKSHFVEVKDTSIGSATKVYLPSANLHALFLIEHMASHFAAIGITLRQVLDWAFFVEKHNTEVDWDWLDGFLEKYHMKDFFNCINAICVEDMGFDASIFPEI